MLKLYYWKEVIPIVLLFVYKDIEVLVQLLINMLHLSICLRMPSSRRDQSYSKKPIEFSSEECNKLWTFI